VALADLLDRLTLTRRLVKSLERIAEAQAAQTQLLVRLADRFAPLPQPATDDDLRTTGPSFSRDADQAALQDFIDDFTDRVRREPTEQELTEWLDERERERTYGGEGVEVGG
jgi:hypothetical protein